MEFSLDKNGYNKSEVDDYIKKLMSSYESKLAAQRERINELDEENEELVEKLKKYTAKESSISNALMVAVDKAKQIEENSKRLYELEIQRLRLLFNKYKEILDDFIEQSPTSEQTSSLRNIIAEFKSSLSDSLNVNLKDKTSAYDPMRLLLNKVNTYIAKRNERELLERVGKANKFDGSDLFVPHDSATQIKPIVNMNLDKDDKFDNLVDKFLETEDDVEKSALAKRIINETSGFDLKEAVNPTEDLEDIMKFFDLD